MDVDEVLEAEPDVFVLLPDADAVAVPFAALPVALAAAAVIVIGIAEDIVANTRFPLLTVRTLVTRNEVETETAAEPAALLYSTPING